MEIYIVPDSGRYFACNTYIVAKNGQGIVIDAGMDYSEISAYAKSKNITLRACFLTHAHFDHIRGAKQMQNDKITVYVSKKDAPKTNDDSLNCGSVFGEPVEPFVADCLLEDGQVVNQIGLNVKVVLTSGHTCGSVCYFISDENAYINGESCHNDIIFTGDTLFYQGYGRVDLPTGDWGQLKGSLKRLMNLEKKYLALCGHGECFILE